ncbi:interleukin-31 receptor subunit alpha [Clarias gariepinus]|uniref:interleukin-31 receptor subunit alpha n=1 Tax=Clarias gariepinus TaxID=13013 RepID=UPI00234CC9F2|nr:interleukin-31 receptor subunit alpha [Clarias gariepinus]
MESFLYFAWLVRLIWSTWIISDASAAICPCKNMTWYEKHCSVSEDEQSLSCFGLRETETIIYYYCTWNPGQYDRQSLYVKQSSCQFKSNFTKQQTKAFRLRSNWNMTACAVAESDNPKACAFSKFSSHPSNIIRCGPPVNVTFKRRYGRLNVTAEWKDSSEPVKRYLLRYRKHNADVWTEVESRNKTNCTVGNVVSYQAYQIQIRCNVTSDCPQCPWSKIITVPPELVEAPIIKEPRYEPIQPGQRKITVQWEYVNSQAVEEYTVTVQKVSGESAEEDTYFLKAQTVTLFLCYSAYNLSIRALNKAGLSPSADLIIDAMEEQSDLDKAFKVTLMTNNSFRLSWNTTLSKKYPCYSVEWWASNEKISYRSFFEKKAFHIIQTQTVAFQSYKRYHFFLHARHEKETCNLKKVNNSDQTYGRAQVYLTEGTPLTAPGNVSCSDVTKSSFVITWHPVPEEELRGFLQGYIIRYTQDNNKENITVDPSVNSYKLMNLRSGSMYCVEVSAYTAAGEGKQSELKCCESLDSMAIAGMFAGVIAGIIALLLATHLCFRILKRSKKLLWPSIPNPCNSNAVQKIEGCQEMEVMELLHWPNREETEAHVSVLEAKKEERSACNVSQDCTKVTFTPSSFPALKNDEPPSSPTTSSGRDSTPDEAFPIDSVHESSREESPAGANDINDSPRVLEAQSVSTSEANPPCAFMSDYTTMELFRQISPIVPLALPGSGIASSDPSQEYLRHSCSPSENTTGTPDS